VRIFQLDLEVFKVACLCRHAASEVGVEAN